MLAGERYHRIMSADPRDLRTRGRFVGLVLDRLAPGGRILDFGAGTGIDAKIYAAAGHEVWTYDPDAEQSACLAAHCREEIARSQVVPTLFPPASRFDAVVANFAVLNLVPDLPGLFRAFSPLLGARGFLLVSLLNPYFLGDARYGWWRANLPRLLREGRYAAGEDGRVQRYRPDLVARAAAPYFRLADIAPRRAALPLRQYMFLLFRPA
jgi:SAM-dependent methyltransferase